MEKLANVHPGEILQFEFLEPLEISVYRLSKDLNIPQTRISEIIKGNRRITADTALRLSKYFGNSAKFWLGLRDDYDIEEERSEKKDEFDEIQKLENKNVAQQRLWFIAPRGLEMFAFIGTNKNNADGSGVKAPNHSQGRWR